MVVEGMADRFKPALSDVYAELMAGVIAGTDRSLDAGRLLDRHRAIRVIRPYRGDHPATVVVLSRVTLGADVAITSVILDAVKRRFPEAHILFAGSRKAWELFAGDPRIGHLEVSYPRGGSLEERLAPWRELRKLIPPDALVIDPDTRITQLGLLPVCEHERYLFFREHRLQIL